LKRKEVRKKNAQFLGAKDWGLHEVAEESGARKSRRRNKEGLTKKAGGGNLLSKWQRKRGKGKKPACSRPAWGGTPDGQGKKKARPR